MDAYIQTFVWAGAAAVLLFVIGAYCMMSARNLIRILIGVEILTKAVTLMLATAGNLSARPGLGQSLIVTLIVVEVVLIAVAAAVVIGSYQHTGSLDAKGLQNLKG